MTGALDRPIGYALAAYNDILRYTLPDTREAVWLIGFQLYYRRRFVESGGAAGLPVKVRDDGRRRVVYLAGEARFLIRRVKDGRVGYEIGEFTDPARPVLATTRTIALSPFPEHGRAASCMWAGRRLTGFPVTTRDGFIEAISGETNKIAGDQIQAPFSIRWPRLNSRTQEMVVSIASR